MRRLSPARAATLVVCVPVENDTQTRAEAEAQVTVGSAGEFALVWLHAVVVMHRWDLAMQSATLAFRTRSASRWIHGAIAAGALPAQDRDNAHSALVALGFEHPLWSLYAEACVHEHAERLAGARRHLALGGRPRPVSVDREEFLVVDYRAVPGVDDDGVKLLESPMDPLWRVVVKHYDWGYLIDASSPAHHT